jgi:hypothetical protein
MRPHRALSLDTNLGKRTACSKKLYGCKWRQYSTLKHNYRLTYNAFVAFANDYECINKGNNKITELRTILYRESQNS